MDRRQTIALRVVTWLVAWRASAACAWLVLPLVLAACGGGDDAPAAANGAAPPTLTAIVVNPGTADLGVGRTLTLTAEARDQYGAVMPGVAFGWASSDSGVVVAIDGVATGVATGTANVTASSGGVTSNPASLNVIVVATGSVAIDKPFVFLSASGQSSSLTAQVFDPNGAPTPDAVTWTSSAPDKVSVDASGRVEAKAVGSALIVAEGGGARSAPTVVVVAEPKPGALLVADAQVVAITEPTAAGSPYEVTLEGVAAPAPGTVVLGAGMAPVVGKVVATRPGTAAGQVIVALAVAPLPQLFAAYDIRLAVDLSRFPAEARSTSAGTSVVSAWNAQRQARPRTLAVHRLDDALSPFRAFNCEAELKPKLVGTPVQLSLDNKLVLTVEDRPGYSKHALEGSAAIVGKAGLKLKAGFAGGGRCDAQAQIKLPILGWVSVVVMPAVRFGLGAELKGEVTLVQGELGVEGQVSVDPVLGWECGGATPDCRGLNAFPVNDKFKTKSSFPAEHGMQAEISAHFYVIAGLDASILLGTLNAGLVEARVGPKQSFDLAFEEDQAERRDYASSYDLKLFGVVEPGPALQKAIEALVEGTGTAVEVKAEFSSDISESPKGAHSVSKGRVRPGDSVDFTVDFDAKTVAYWQLGYNVERVDLYRKAEGESEFVFWKAMTLVASNRATYRWTPVESEAGKYEFAALVSTQLPVPSLEVAADSVRTVEVSCFSASGAAQRAQALAANARGSRSAPAAASTCADVWIGQSTFIAGSHEENITATASIRWTYDPTTSSDGTVSYKATGTFQLSGAHAGCVVEFSPSTFTINDELLPRLTIANGQYFFDAQQPITSTETVTCPGTDPVVNHLKGFYIHYGFGGGGFTPELVTLAGSLDAPLSSWSFSRP